MERVKKYLITGLFILLAGVYPASAEVMPQNETAQDSSVAAGESSVNLSTLVTPQNVSFEICTKTFAMNSDRLFYLTLAAVNANRFEIKEIQSKTGYILFMAVGKEFLASVISIDKYRSMLKITPANNNYFFAPGIVLNMYKYIELNASEHLQNIPKGG